MRRLLFLLPLMLLLPAPAMAAGGGGTMYSFLPDLGNRASLQRGAKYYMNYCSGCHSLEYMRYNRIGEDLDIPEDLLKENLMFTSSNPGDPITIARRDSDSERWFGAAPPDLSVKMRHRGANWVYSFLKTFYLDDSKATGVNNPTLQGTSMPHVLGNLQGWQRPVYQEVTTADGQTRSVIHDFEIVEPGELSEEEYDRVVADIVNFLTYVAEPARLSRFNVGIFALAFLMLFTTFAWLLKKEYWKDVH